MLIRRVEYKEVERDVQKGGEDNSDGGIPFFHKTRLIERKGQEDADDGRGEHMEERRTDETEVPREDGLDHRVSRERREEEKGVLEPGEAERDGDHVDHGVDWLVIVAPMKDREPRERVFGEFLDGRPCGEGRRLGRQEARDVFLDGDDDDDRDHARDEGEGDEAPRLRVGGILFEPDPEPRERRKDASRDGYGIGFDARHRHIVASAFADMFVLRSLSRPAGLALSLGAVAPAKTAKRTYPTRFPSLEVLTSSA